MDDVIYAGLFAFFFTLFHMTLKPLMLGALPILFPLKASRRESEKVTRLEKKYEEEISTVAAVEFVLCLIAMGLAPLLNYNLLVWILSSNAGPGDDLTFFGGGVVILFSAIGGAVYGARLTRTYIWAHYRRLPELAWWYARSEDRHGAAGRFIIRNSGVIAAALMLLPALFVSNHYTLVGPGRIEIPDPRHRFFSRLTLANNDIVEIARAPGRDDVYFVRYDDGRVLNTVDCTWGTVRDHVIKPDNCIPADTVGFLSAAVPVPITQ